MMEPDSNSESEGVSNSNNELLSSTNEDKSSPKSSWLAPLTLDYYQSYFDVSSNQVMERIVAGMIPVRFKLVASLHPNPDLYGPFWLAMTLILTTAISGNISHLIDKQIDWEFHFHEVTLIGCCVYTYTWLVPCGLWALLWWRGNRLRYTLLQLLAIYGYSIAIFIPLMVFWLIRNEVIRWVLWTLCTFSSGSVLVTALWKPMSQENSKLAVCVLLMIFFFHAGLSASFKLYYFSSALTPSDTPIIILNTTAT